MDKILYLDHVDQYNRLYGLETLHPLVSVINLNEATRAVGTINWKRHATSSTAARNTITKKGPSSVSLPDKQQRRRRQSGIYKPMLMASSSIPTCFAARH